MDFSKILVTGATSGIGAALVRSLSARGKQVLGVARRAEALADLAAETGCEILVGDVRQTDILGSAISSFEPDVVINNAGVGHGITGLADLDTAAIREAFEINVIAPAQITAVAIDGMKRRGRGHIVNIGSIAGCIRCCRPSMAAARRRSTGSARTCVSNCTGQACE